MTKNAILIITIVSILVLSNRGQFESGSKSQIISPSSPPPPIQNLNSPPPISSPSQIQPIINPNQLVNYAVQQQQQQQQQPPLPPQQQQQPLPSQSIPISSIILEPPQNTLVHPNISLVSGFEAQAQPQVINSRLRKYKKTKFNFKSIVFPFLFKPRKIKLIGKFQKST